MRVKVKFTDGTKAHFEIRPWCTVKDLKDQIFQAEQIPANVQRIFRRGVELRNNWPLTLAEEGAVFFCTHRAASTSAAGTPTATVAIRGTSSDCAPVLRTSVRAAQRGMQRNLKPKLADDGSGGTYFLRGADKQYVAVFKPRDEEPGGVHNPRGYVGEHGQIMATRGILAGQASDRELAAYLLDHASFAGVPPTALAEASHRAFHYADGRQTTKVGILQQFVPSDDVAGNFSSSMFPVDDVHRIALLDMRLLNTDRNDANILVQRDWDQDGQRISRLVPIDHGYCLPISLNLGWCDWCWYSWKQMQQPMSPATLRYIASLDAERDAFRLRRETSIHPQALQNMQVATALLKIGAEAGLSLGDIASLMVREDPDLEIPSELEVAVSRATALTESMMRSPRLRFVTSGSPKQEMLHLPSPLLAAAHATTKTMAPHEVVEFRLPVSQMREEKKDSQQQARVFDVSPSRRDAAPSPDGSKPPSPARQCSDVKVKDECEDPAGARSLLKKDTLQLDASTPVTAMSMFHDIRSPSFPSPSSGVGTEEKLFIPESSPERKQQRRERRKNTAKPPFPRKTCSEEKIECVFSDDERFLRSPRRRASSGSLSPTTSPRESKPLSSSPPSPIWQLPRRGAAAGRSITRTMSFCDLAAARGKGLVPSTQHVARTALRCETNTVLQRPSSDVKRARPSSTSAAGVGIGVPTSKEAFNRVFLSYLNKLLADLVELKLRSRRARRMSEEQQEVTDEERISQGPFEFSKSDSSGDESP